MIDLVYENSISSEMKKFIALCLSTYDLAVLELHPNFAMD